MSTIDKELLILKQCERAGLWQMMDSGEYQLRALQLSIKTAKILQDESDSIEVIQGISEYIKLREKVLFETVGYIEERRLRIAVLDREIAILKGDVYSD